MNLRTPLVGTLIAIALSALVFHFVQRQLSEATFAFGAHPEVLGLLEASLVDQKRLADLDPAARAAYRGRFAAIEATLHRLQILSHSRADVVARYELVLLAVFGVVVAGVGGSLAWRQSRGETRLARLQDALSELARGRPAVETGDRGRDTIGRIARMIEETSRRMAGDRQRLALLENLSAWQEATRRHAHELRTPLTGLRLELARLAEAVAAEPPAEPREASLLVDGALEELDRLTRFTRRFSSFARLPQPQPVEQDLTALLAELVQTYAQGWPGLEIRLEDAAPARAAVDREMLRQVLVNLWQNSADAVGETGGTTTVSVTSGDRVVEVLVADDGPGVPPEIRDRLFQPYVTGRHAPGRSIGEGMGLGLAISKKILLDHGGDLELASSPPTGAVFRLTLPTVSSLGERGPS